MNYHGKPIPLEAAIYQSLFASWLEPVNASLAFAHHASCCSGSAILYVLYRKNIVFKV